MRRTAKSRAGSEPAVSFLARAGRRVCLGLGLGLGLVPHPLGAQIAPAIELRPLRTVPQDVTDSVRAVLDGAATIRLERDHVVAARDTIARDILVLGGRLTIDGMVNGNVVAINSDVLVRAAGRVTGSVTVIGGGLTSLSTGVVDGAARVYPAPVRIERDAGRVVVRDESEDETWYRQRMSPRRESGSELRLVTARTYNRVEGLPLLLGPRLRLSYWWGRVTLDAMGVLRSADRFELRTENLGHVLNADVRIGGPYGVRLGIRHDDVVDATEGSYLTDAEVGLASFLLHRDFRDYYGRRGMAVTIGAFLDESLEADASWSDERWGPRAARDPWSLLRDNQAWRPNPDMDGGRFHLVRLTASYDTRNDRADPWSGWYATAAYEYGTGRISRYAPTSQGVRDVNPTGRTVYDRLVVDVRRYNRVSAEGQLNVRLVGGGWLSGDDLPLQRRFSLGGAGSLPGYDFRQILPGTDFLTCSGTRAAGAPGAGSSPPGTPAQCERFLLAQVEYRGEIGSKLFGFLDEERRKRRLGWGRKAEWVVFANAGRGWLVGERTGALQYGSTALPGLPTFRADVGLGLRLDDLGLYVSKAVTDARTPLNFFVRLRPRF